LTLLHERLCLVISLSKSVVGTIALDIGTGLKLKKHLQQIADIICLKVVVGKLILDESD
jgi:hypothetical protein